MNALETLTAVTGCEPTTEHRMDATDYGGQNDPDTIASIAEQFRVWGLALWYSRGLLPGAAEIAAHIDLRSWDRARDWKDRADRMANGWKEREHLHANPIVWVYVERFKRLPDEAGLRYWTEELRFRGLDEIERDMLANASDEDRARMQNG